MQQTPSNYNITNTVNNENYVAVYCEDTLYWVMKVEKVLKCKIKGRWMNKCDGHYVLGDPDVIKFKNVVRQTASLADFVVFDMISKADGIYIVPSDVHQVLCEYVGKIS